MKRFQNWARRNDAWFVPTFLIVIFLSGIVSIGSLILGAPHIVADIGITILGICVIVGFLINY